MPVKMGMMTATFACDGFIGLVGPRCPAEERQFGFTEQALRSKMLAARWHHSATSRGTFWLCPQCQEKVHERFKALGSERVFVTMPNGVISSPVSPTHLFEYKLQHCLAALDREVFPSIAPSACSGN